MDLGRIFSHYVGVGQRNSQARDAEQLAREARRRGDYATYRAAMQASHQHRQNNVFAWIAHLLEAFSGWHGGGGRW